MACRLAKRRVRVTFRIDLRLIDSRAALIAALGTDEASFEAVLGFDPPTGPTIQTADPLALPVIDIPIFFRHDIPKRNRARGFRTVWEPAIARAEFKALARRLESFFRLAMSGFPHDSAYGYRPGRNIRENAAQHAGHANLLVVDLLDFFPSISAERIVQLFVSLGVIDDVADLLARFVTINGHLPMGLPTSPVISNAVALPLDSLCQALADATGATYTRYADDLSFSGNGDLPEIEQIRQMVEEQGFLLADRKTRRSRIGQAHFVTGLSISDPLQPHIPRATKHKLRQELYYATKFGLGEHLRFKGINDARVVQQQVNRIDGTVRFVAHHEPRLSPQIKTQWSEALRADGMKPSFAPRGQGRAPFYLFIDEAEIKHESRTILALGIAVTQNAEALVTAGIDALQAALADLFAAGDRQALIKRGLHFTDATEDLRFDYVKRLAQTRFEGYVAFTEFHRPDLYETTYLRLLNAVIRRRLMAAESQFALLRFEQNNKVSSVKIKDLIARVFADLKAHNNRRPLEVMTEFVTKPDAAISAPDFLLGVLGRYLKAPVVVPGKPVSRDRLMFERLRDKYRLIFDVTNNVEYSRRRPIRAWADESANPVPRVT